MRQNRLQISVSFQVREILSPKIGGGVERRGRGCTKLGAAWSAGGMVAHWGGVERRGRNSRKTSISQGFKILNLTPSAFYPLLPFDCIIDAPNKSAARTLKPTSIAFGIILWVCITL